MISDSPYETWIQAAPAWVGAIAGCAGSAAGAWAAAAIHAARSQGAASGSWSLGVWAGILILGTILGLMHSLSQRKAPAGILLGVGAMYGFLLWILCAWVGALAIPSPGAAFMRSGAGISGFLFYGVILGASASAANALRGADQSAAIPKD